MSLAGSTGFYMACKVIKETFYLDLFGKYNNIQIKIAFVVYKLTVKELR